MAGRSATSLSAHLDIPPSGESAAPGKNAVAEPDPGLGRNVGSGHGMVHGRTWMNLGKAYTDAGRSSQRWQSSGNNTVTTSMYPSTLLHNDDKPFGGGAGRSASLSASPSIDAHSRANESSHLSPTRALAEMSVIQNAATTTQSSVGNPTVASTGPVIIDRAMATTQIVAHLGEHGCEDVTELLDLSTSSEWPISSGGFGDIYRVRLHDSTEVAVKTTRVHVSSTTEGRKYLKHAAQELHAWSKCSHPNVIKLLGLAIFRGQIGMVSLWMENGNLPTYLARNPEVDRYTMSAQISEGLAYLHSIDMVHGDLKGLNVLVSSAGTPVLTDFGNAYLSNPSLQFTATTSSASVSLRWSAPELLESDASNPVSKEADVYALGMTILETITGDVPYSGKSEQAVMFCLWQKRIPDRPTTIPSTTECGNKLWALLLRCWAHDPKDRPGADEVLKLVKRVMYDELGLDK